MTVTRESRSITMTADTDAVTGPLYIREIRFAGTGLTPGQRLTILDEASGSVLVDHFVELASQDKVVFHQPGWVKGLLITAYPAGGTSQVLVGLY